MVKGCLMNKLGALLAASIVAMFAGCSNTTSGNDSAGILIETNTGNKGFARVYVGVDLWNLSVDDTVSLALSERDTVGDTVYVYENDYRKVVDSAAFLAGVLQMDSVPVGEYDSVKVYEADGGIRTIAVDLEIEKDESYFVDEEGAIPVTQKNVSVNTGTAQFYVSVESFELETGDSLLMKRSESKHENDTLFVIDYIVAKKISAEDVERGIVKIENVPAGEYDQILVSKKSGETLVSKDFEEALTLSETSVFVTAAGVSELGSVSIALPEGFDDLSDADESFKDVPFPIFLPTSLNAPCLLDADDNVIKLEVAESDYYKNRVLYWGKASEVKFSKKGDVDFKVIPGCVESNDESIAMGTYKNHFSDATMSDAASALFKDKDDLLGHSRWVDSTDSWLYITDFEPFSEDGHYMGLSIWFNIDSMQVGEYAQIVSAKKDSVGFTLQKRGSSGAVNLRLDTRTGVYNTVVGRANGVLDGTWHNYSFKIHGDSVTTFIDGKLLESKQFDSGEGFAKAFNPGVGYGGLRGGIDELFFFDGTQSRNWMRLFYALQKSALE